MSWRLISRTLLVSAALFLCLGSCGSDPQNEYTDAQARLEPKASHIILPLESYAMNNSEVRDVTQANNLLIDDCLERKGRNLALAKAGTQAMTFPPDRRYGIWSIRDAENAGFEIPRPGKAKELAAKAESRSLEWEEDYGSCRSNVEILPVLGINWSMDLSPVDQGMRDSFDSLLASSTFDDVRSAWVKCIEPKGLTPNPDSTVLDPVIPSPGEEQIRVAILDAQCKQSLNVVQQLADFEARDQMAYIEDHESELTSYRDKVDKVLEAARKVIATHGG